MRAKSPLTAELPFARPLACPFGATALRSATLAIARLSSARVAFCGGCSSALLGLRAPLRTFREDGGDAGGLRRPKASAALFGQASLLKAAALAFPPPAGVASYSMRGTLPRTIYRRTAAECGLRGLRLFSPDGENRSPRGGRNRDTTPHDDRTRGTPVATAFGGSPCRARGIFALRFERRGVRLGR